MKKIIQLRDFVHRGCFLVDAGKLVKEKKKSKVRLVYILNSLELRLSKYYTLDLDKIVALTE